MLQLDRKKLDIELARQCLNVTELVELADVSNALLTRLFAGKCTLTTKTLGKLAKALNVDPTKLIKDEWRQQKKPMAVNYRQGGDIEGYVSVLENSKLRSLDFFVKSVYIGWFWKEVKIMSYTKDNLTVVFADFFPIRAGEAKEKIQQMIKQIQLAEYRHKQANRN